jgi:hypothetical protein
MAKSTYAFYDMSYLIIAIVFLLIVIFVSTYYINGNSMLENFARPTQGWNAGGTWAVEYYYSNNCSSCRTFDNTGNWEALKSKYSNKFRFDKFLNTSSNGKILVKKYNITAFPTIIITWNQNPKGRITGNLPNINALENFIKEFI